MKYAATLFPKQAVNRTFNFIKSIQTSDLFFRALYNGIVPGLQRQMAFSAIRIGAYEPVKQKYIQLSGAESSLSLLGVRIAAGVTTGTIGK